MFDLIAYLPQPLVIEVPKPVLRNTTRSTAHPSGFSRPGELHRRACCTGWRSVAVGAIRLETRGYVPRQLIQAMRRAAVGRATARDSSGGAATDGCFNCGGDRGRGVFREG